MAVVKKTGYADFPIKRALGAVAGQEDFVILETSLPDARNRHSYLFMQPVFVLELRPGEDVKSFFDRMESALDSGLYLAGFFSYELGYLLEAKLEMPLKTSFPLAWLGAYREPVIFDHAKGKFLKGRIPKECAEEKGRGYRLSRLKLNMKKSEYTAAIRKIKRLIEKGDTYQVNFTLKYKFGFTGSAHSLFLALRNNQPVAYSCYIRAGARDILSFSPELFIRKKGNLVSVRPMKGTAKRGRTLTEDRSQADFLENDPKNRSENVMIVDLLRNDLGRLAKTGSVRVKKLFEVERYETLFQMTSTIESEMKEGQGLLDVFHALFPSGSVTGAPKIRTMEIIRDLEKEYRGVYTGSIGFISPSREAAFNVSIRTVVLEGATGEMGVGSGIVYDSDPAGEYDECVLKGRFLSSPRPEFSLIETMLWKKETGYYLLDLHLERLKSSACYFNFPFSAQEIKTRLKELEKGFDKNSRLRVRLLLEKSGKINLSAQELERASSGKNLITLSRIKTDSSDPFLFHKTTLREVYDKELERARKKGFFEVVFINENDCLTEGAFTNIFLEKNGVYYTPSLECGLLDGVFRRNFINRNPGKVVETELKVSDLYNADQIYVANSVRGLVPVTFKKPTDKTTSKPVN